MWFENPGYDPCVSGTRVEVEFMNGVISDGLLSSNWVWTVGSSGYHIKRYRVRKYNAG